MSEGGYIQGAGDDSEAWAHGLTPTIFWEHKDKLMNTAEEELPQLIDDLIESCRPKETLGTSTLVKPTSNIYIRMDSGINETQTSSDLEVHCNRSPETSDQRRLNLGCPSGKLGSRHLRKILKQVEDFVAGNLNTSPSRIIVVTCDKGTDLSVGTVLMILCLFYNDQGTLYFHYIKLPHHPYIAVDTHRYLLIYPHIRPISRIPI